MEHRSSKPRSVPEPSENLANRILNMVLYTIAVYLLGTRNGDLVSRSSQGSGKPSTLESCLKGDLLSRSSQASGEGPSTANAVRRSDVKSGGGLSLTCSTLDLKPSAALA